MGAIDDIYIPAGEYLPEVDFKFSNNSLTLRGESFPENAIAFYSPILIPLFQYLKEKKAKNITINFELRYFNSATARLLYKMFDQFSMSVEECGHTIEVIIVFENEDIMIQEFGVDMQKEYPNLNFTEKALPEVS